MLALSIGQDAGAWLVCTLVADCLPLMQKAGRMSYTTMFEQAMTKANRSERP